MLACRAVGATRRAARARPPELPAARAARAARRARPDPAPGRPDGAPWIALPAAECRATPGALAEALAGAHRGVVVAGTGRDPATAPSWRGPPRGRLAGARRPAERRPARATAAVAHYDALLRDAGVRRRPPTRPGAARRRSADVQAAARVAGGACRTSPQVAFAPPSVWADPDARRRELLPGAAAATLAAAELPRPRPAGWRAGARRTRASATRSRWCWATSSASRRSRASSAPTLPADGTLVVASSMPVRDVESFAAVRDDAPRVPANRGANGIDGTVSTAFGVALASGGPVVALLGDLALLHDVGGLLAAGASAGPRSCCRPEQRRRRHLRVPARGRRARLLRGARRDAARRRLRARRRALRVRARAGRRTSRACAPRSTVRSGAAGRRSSRSAPNRGANLALHRRATEAALAAISVA